MTAAPAIESHAPGTFCWAELGTTDTAAAKQFYTSLFGWGVDEHEMAPGEVYTIWTLNGLQHAAMYKLTPDMLSQGTPPNWTIYVSVEDVDATVESAKDAGATILVPPSDVMDLGRMAVFADPQGAVLSLWEPKAHIGARIINTIGTFGWGELATTNTAAAEAFYTSTLGWKASTKKSGPPDRKTDYTEWVVGGAHIGGMLEIMPEWGDVPPNWMPYFQVTDCLETVEKARKLGGKVEFGPMSIENVGSFALIVDPTGARFYVIELGLVA